MSLVRRAAAVSAGLLGAGAALYVGVHQGYVPVPGQDPGRDTVVASVDLVGNGAHRWIRYDVAAPAGTCAESFWELLLAQPLPDELYADPDELHDLSLARGMTYSVWSSELGSNAMDVERMARMPDQGNPAATAVASVRLSARVPPGRPMQQVVELPVHSRYVSALHDSSDTILVRGERSPVQVPPAQLDILCQGRVVASKQATAARPERMVWQVPVALTSDKAASFVSVVTALFQLAFTAALLLASFGYWIGIDMRTWTAGQAKRAIQDALRLIIRSISGL